jgi:ribosomal protein S27E
MTKIYKILETEIKCNQCGRVISPGETWSFTLDKEGQGWIKCEECGELDADKQSV